MVIELCHHALKHVVHRLVALRSGRSDDSAWTKTAKEILERTGAEDVSSTGEASADFSKTDKPMERAS